jgi:hypothetical protein
MAGGKLGEVAEGTLLKAAEKIVQKFFMTFIDHMAAQPHVAPPPIAPPPEAHGLRNSRWSWAVVTVLIVAFVGYHTFFT